MFARFVTLLPLAALAAVVAAAPNVLEARATCSSGSEYCCNQELSNPATFEKDSASLLGLLLGLGANVGAECTPITVIGALSNGAQCTQQTACCDHVNQNGLINIGCSNFNVPV
ncbi:fungal hydrophobin-domain-containing protein [Boletus edulis BED1]|uniref:Hydrophobin n=1 Tax=Boletus edulis BED1 TaxID=1328754 RepID=A0AAD4BR68_BOLED|nr:fungal hydrophobin-domain-containing protein [Boletus edulis BED1]